MKSLVDKPFPVTLSTLESKLLFVNFSEGYFASDVVTLQDVTIFDLSCFPLISDDVKKPESFVKSLVLSGMLGLLVKSL